MTHILITGGTGFIGSHTCVDLLNMGFKVTILDSLINSKREIIKNILSINSINKSNIDFINGDIRDRNILTDIFTKSINANNPIQAVINFAGLKSVNESIISPIEYWDNNVSGMINLVKIMDEFNCYKIVFSSSATIYGDSNSSLIKEDASFKPINPYGQTKATIERFLNDILLSSRRWSIANLRYFNPIGAHESGLLGEDPLNKTNNIFPIILKVASGELDKLTIFGNDWPTPDGTGIRDYVHVMDLAEAHCIALKKLLVAENKRYNLNIGTGKGTSVLELIHAFEISNGVKINYIFDSRRDGDLAICVADNSEAIKVLEWNPSRSIYDMCRDSWRWKCN